MNSFVVALSAVVPMMIMLAIGQFLKLKKVMDEPFFRKLSMLTFKLFLSVSVYYNIYTADFETSFNKQVLAYVVLLQFVVVGISIVTGNLMEKTKRRQGAVAHCLFHTNTVIYPTLIGNAVLGEGNLGIIAFIIAILVPIQNIVSAIVLELYRDTNAKINLKKLLKSVVTNPFVFAAILGTLTKIVDLRFPLVLANVLRDLARCGTPVALIAMGGLLNFSAFRGNLRTVVLTTVVRLFIIPGVLIFLSVFLGYSGPNLLGVMCLTMTPPAVNCFNMAVAMDSDEDLTSEIIVVASVASLFSVFFWIYLISSMGLLAV